MSLFYENVLLREEFNLVQKLQKNTEFAKYVSVTYEDRVTGETKNVLSQPTVDKYPEVYIVNYRMPVYSSSHQIRNDFHGTAKIIMSESVLTNRELYNNYHADYNGPHVEWDYNFQPYGVHLFSKDSYGICSGTAWNIAKDYGLWHFIISLGALLNQDYFILPLGSNTTPVSNIKWPLDLISQGIKIVPKETIDKPKITVIRKKEEQSPLKKTIIIKK